VTSEGKGHTRHRCAVSPRGNLSVHRLFHQRYPAYQSLTLSVYGDEAISNPVIVTKNRRDRIALVNINQYEKMRRAYDLLVSNTRGLTGSASDVR